MSGFWTDGVTAYGAATLNKFIVGDTETSGFYQSLWYRIYYNGAAWVVDTAYGSKRSASDIAAAWNAGDKRLDLTFSGILKNFTDKPTAIVSPEATAADGTPNYAVQARVTAATTALVRFIDPAAGTTITTEGTRMAFYLNLAGPID